MGNATDTVSQTSVPIQHPTVVRRGAWLGIAGPGPQHQTMSSGRKD